ncbi:MAG: permease, partial [Thermodesulfobacteriota bacterium]|nr:permease [Thermodesulfobacteriota bacterium]
LTYAFGELWGDIALWLLLGLILAGLISTLIPTDFFSTHLGGGVHSMIIMLAVGIPLYICATASTPIAAALILNGVSPGAALVFLLTGPATNVTSLTVLLKILGKRSTVLYLLSIAVFSILFGLFVDKIYSLFHISAQAMVGHAAEVIPGWAQICGALSLLALSIKPVYRAFKSQLAKITGRKLIPSCDCPNEQELLTKETHQESCSCKYTA